MLLGRRVQIVVLVPNEVDDKDEIATESDLDVLLDLVRKSAPLSCEQGVRLIDHGSVSAILCVTAFQQKSGSDAFIRGTELNR